MAGRNVAPYGSWRSPITSDMVASAAVSLSQIALDGEDVYWVEQRPEEGGRRVIVRLDAAGSLTDVTPSPFNARTLVHEYGGGDFLVDGRTVYFSNYVDQRVYRQEPGMEPRPITPKGPFRYADASFDKRHGRIICVREDHSSPDRKPNNTLVSIPLEGNRTPQALIAGNDFYASPRLSPDGARLAWITWNHPDMPWDGTQLWVADIENDGSVGQRKQVAGGVHESILQPEWSPKGRLFFVSDRTGWWNIYSWDGKSVDSVCELEAEFGLPPWIFGLSTYAVLSEDEIVSAYVRGARWRLASLDVNSGDLKDIETPHSYFEYVRGDGEKVYFVAGSASRPASIVRLDLGSQELQELRRSSQIKLEEQCLSTPEPIEFPTEAGKAAYAYFYPPKNPDFGAPPEEKPPLLVMSHGGPTSATRPILNLAVQHWTSRGLAVLDVNYGGSTGHGRQYRLRLEGKWGLVDVDDCVNAARYLIARGQADADRVAIRGGSAGGYTTLRALTLRDFFRAGASYYGISDLEALAKETHKFESRYLDRLIGPYPDRIDRYRDRSPINHLDRLSCPIIFFQGLEDVVVPPNQAETMVVALRDKGLPVAYVAFEGEQHGFRQAENIKRAHDAELYFYSKIFGFEVAETLEPVLIENL